MMNHADTGRDREPAETPLRDVVAAWLVLAVLLVATCVSFTLDHMVTVSDRPDWSSLAPAAGRAPAEDGAAGQPRELRDAERR
jgi:hypothetical protein